MAILNVNTDATVALTNRLEKLHRSDFPIAVRNTLSKAAFLTKKESLPKIADRTFVNRTKNFFRAKSRFIGAKGFNLKTMKAIVGMIDLRTSSDDHAVRDLEQQERGGTISGRSFIPTDKARVAGNAGRNVAPRNRLSRLDLSNVVRTSDSKGKTRGQRFIKSVILAKEKFGDRALVLTRNMLFRVNSLGFNKRLKKLRLKITPLYTFESGRTVSVTATNFMRKSSLIQAKKLGIIYKIEAEKRIKRARL